MATLTMEPKKTKKLSRYEILLSKLGEAPSYAAVSNQGVLLQFIIADPTSKNNGLVPNDDWNLARVKAIQLTKQECLKIKVGEYVSWIIDRYNELEKTIFVSDVKNSKELMNLRNRFMEDLYKVNFELTKFHRFKSKLPIESRDINKLQFHQLEDLMAPFTLEKKKGTVEEKKAAQTSYEYPGSEVAFRGEKWTVVKIWENTELAKDAACFFGGYDLKPIEGETNWCTSSPGSYNRYFYHSEKGPLYVVLPNDSKTFGNKTGLPTDRFQFHFPTNQFMDKHDRSIDLVNFLNTSMLELKEFFKPEFAAGVTEGGEELSVDSSSHGALGKFISLYGLDDLFDNLPLTLKKIHIKNDNSDVNFVLPKSIFKFKNLESLFLKNCVDTIPEEITQLSKLVFIAFEGNNKLRSIPDGIVHLPNLLFINLKGNPNLVVSDYFKNHSFEFAPNMWKGKGMLKMEI